MVQFNAALRDFALELEAGRDEDATLLARQILELESEPSDIPRAQRARLLLQKTLEVARQHSLEVSSDLTRLLLENGAQPNPMYAGDFDALALAIEVGSEPVARLLLDFGADGRSVAFGSYKKSVLVRAIEAGLSDVALRLLELGADFQGEPGEPKPLQAAARIGDERVARALLERGADPNTQFSNSLNTADPNGRTYSPAQTPLMEAVEKDGNPVLSLLLENGADANALNEAQQNALFAAASLNAPQNIRALLVAGAQAGQVDAWGKTALQMASANVWGQDASESVALLLDAGAERSELDKSIILAIGRGDAKCVQLFINAGAETKKPGGDSPFVILARGGNLPRAKHDQISMEQAMADDLAVAQLLWDAGARPMPSEVTEAMEWAAASGHTELIKWLGAIGGERPGSNSESPLLLAASNGHRESVEELLSQGEIAGLRRDSDGFTPLIALACDGAARRFFQAPYEFFQHPQPDEWVEENDAAIAQMLLAADANLEARTSTSLTALHLAASFSAPRVVQLILEGGADVGARNSWQRTALHSAMGTRIQKARAPFGREPHRIQDTEQQSSFPFGSFRQLTEEWDEKIVALLLATSLDIEARDHGGWTALHLAAMFAAPRIVAQLLQAGANIQARDNRNLTPREAVFAFGRVQVALRSQGFALQDFPGLRADLKVLSAVPTTPLPTYIANAKPELQRAIQYDSEVLHLLDA